MTNASSRESVNMATFLISIVFAALGLFMAVMLGAEVTSNPAPTTTGIVLFWSAIGVSGLSILAARSR
jgi:hypothetical protein